MTKAASADRSGASESAGHIARVAARLFASQGYDATSVRTIVEAAGVTKPTLYYHFGSKEGLAQALVDRPLGDLIERLGSIVDGPSDPVAAIEQIFDAHFAFVREDPDRARFVFALFFGPHGSNLAADLAGLSERLTELLRCSIRRLAAVGIIEPDRVADCTRACRGMIVIAAMDYLYQGRELGPGLAAGLVRDVLRGFAGGGGRAGFRGDS